MHSATIPIAALATFAAVYWLAPAPAVRELQPSPVAEAAAPADGGVETHSASAVPAAKRAKVRRGRTAARPRRPAAATARAVRPARRAKAVSVYFSGCREVRAAGLAPLLRGEPGYRPEMDGDDDGIACEPWRGRRR
jgi:hypothetical protein